jgi:hypothetical protein
MEDAIKGDLGSSLNERHRDGLSQALERGGQSHDSPNESSPDSGFRPGRICAGAKSGRWGLPYPSGILWIDIRVDRRAGTFPSPLIIGENVTMHFERRFTHAGAHRYAGIEFRSATSEIRNPDGSVVFKLENIEVPATWSQVAADIKAKTRSGTFVVRPAADQGETKRSAGRMNCARSRPRETRVLSAATWQSWRSIPELRRSQAASVHFEFELPSYSLDADFNPSRPNPHCRIL